MAGVSGRTPPKVAVLKGGPSAEREVSLVSGRECAAALRGEGFPVVEIDAGADLVARLQAEKPDVVFNALHGRWGEDGCVQGILEWLRIPYTHSGVLASALAMDKTHTKDIYRAAGLPVAASLVAASDEVRARHVMEPPYVVKPNNEGSSVGIYLVHEAANRPPALADTMPSMVMVEEYVAGRELTVTVMGERALGVTEIFTDGWYDYDAKYKPGGSWHKVPDFRWDEAKGMAGLFLLETNTQPGMTPTSLVPEQAAALGMSFGALCAWIVEDASCDR